MVDKAQQEKEEKERQKELKRIEKEKKRQMELEASYAALDIFDGIYTNVDTTPVPAHQTTIMVAVVFGILMAISIALQAMMYLNYVQPLHTTVQRYHNIDQSYPPSRQKQTQTQQN